MCASLSTSTDGKALLNWRAVTRADGTLTGGVAAVGKPQWQLKQLVDTRLQPLRETLQALGVRVACARAAALGFDDTDEPRTAQLATANHAPKVGTFLAEPSASAAALALSTSAVPQVCSLVTCANISGQQPDEAVGSKPREGRVASTHCVSAGEAQRHNGVARSIKVALRPLPHGVLLGEENHLAVLADVVKHFQN